MNLMITASMIVLALEKFVEMYALRLKKDATHVLARIQNIPLLLPRLLLQVMKDMEFMEELVTRETAEEMAATQKTTMAQMLLTKTTIMLVQLVTIATMNSAIQDMRNTMAQPSDTIPTKDEAVQLKPQPQKLNGLNLGPMKTLLNNLTK